MVRREKSVVEERTQRRDRRKEKEEHDVTVIKAFIS